MNHVYRIWRIITVLPQELYPRDSYDNFRQGRRHEHYDEPPRHGHLPKSRSQIAHDSRSCSYSYQQRSPPSVLSEEDNPPSRASMTTTICFFNSSVFELSKYASSMKVNCSGWPCRGDLVGLLLEVFRGFCGSSRRETNTGLSTDGSTCFSWVESRTTIVQKVRNKYREKVDVPCKRFCGYNHAP
jgi:hypothetical protein